MTGNDGASGLITKLIEKNAGCPHIVTADHLTKLVQVEIRASKIKEELSRIFDSGDKEHFEKVINAILCNPNIVVMGGNVFEMASVTALRSIDSKMESKVTDLIRAREAEGQSSKEQEIFMDIMARLWMTDRSGINSLTQKDFERERITFSIEPKEKYNARSRKFGVFAKKYVTGPRIRYLSSLYPEDPDQNGVWQFSDFIIALEIDGTKSSDGTYKLSFDLEPIVLWPRPYIHPYVYDSGTTCLGKFRNSETQMQLKSMPFLKSIYHYLNQLEHMFKTGYSDRHIPARGTMNNPEFILPEIHVFNTFEEEREDWIKKATAEIDGIHEMARKMNKITDKMW